MAANKLAKKPKEPTPRQMKLISERAAGKSYAEAAVAAGYTTKHPRQAGFQAMQQMRGRVPDLLDKHGLSEEVLIDKYGHLSKVDSSGVSIMIETYVSLKRHGGDLKLLYPGGRVLQVLTVFHVLDIIPNFDDEAQALASFGLRSLS